MINCDIFHFIKIKNELSDVGKSHDKKTCGALTNEPKLPEMHKYETTDVMKC